MDFSLQSTARRFPLKAYLSSDHVSPATGKTLAVQISKNGTAFANPIGGATNATEIGSGWYYVDLDTTDTGTLGPLLIRATASGVDDVERETFVRKATNLGLSGVPDAAAGAAGGLPTLGTGSGQINPSSGKVPATVASGDDADAASIKTTIGVAGAGLTSLGDSRLGNLDAAITSRAAAATALSTATWTTARAGYLDNLSAGAVATASAVAAIPTNPLTTLGTNAPAGWINSAAIVDGALNDKGNWLTSLGTVAPSWYTDAPTSSVLAAAVWDQATSGHTTSGTFGAAMNAAGSAGDPWATALPGSYAAGSAGYLLSHTPAVNVTQINGQSATASAVDANGVPVVSLAPAQPGYAPAKAGDAMTLTSAYDAAKTASQVTTTDLTNAVAPVKAKTDLLNSTVTGTIDATVMIDGKAATAATTDASGNPIVSLAASGLDAIAIETGLNARQAIAVIAADAVGNGAGFDTANPATIAAAGVPGTNRITVTTTSSGRTVTLNPPA